MGLPFENADYNEDEVGARKIPELTDVVLTDLANNEILVYNSSSEVWENQAQSSSIIEIDDISGVTITNVQNNQFLKYDNGEWINANITDNDTDNLNDLTDTLLTSPFGNDEVLKYDLSSGKWVNGNIPIEKLSNVHISNLQDGETLRYIHANGRWENVNNIDTLNELSDVNVSSNLNNHVLKYNNSTGVYENQFVNLTDLGDTNITTLANGNTLIYNNGIWSAGNISLSTFTNGTGISVTGTSPNFTITNTAPDLPVSFNNGTGISVTGNYPTFTITNTYQETDPVFSIHPASGITPTLIGYWNSAYGWGDHAAQNYLNTSSPAGSIQNGTGFLKNNGSGTWTYDTNTYLTSANIYQLGGLTWSNVNNNELIRRSGSTSADGAGMTLHDTSSPSFPQTTYYKDVSYFGRHGLLTIPFGVNRFESSFVGYNQRLIPYAPILLSTTPVSGLYLHHLPSINDYNVRVGVNNQYPSQDFQVGTTLYVDNTNRRVGIGIANPEEDLEVDGSIQIDSANVARLKFQQSGQNPHALGEIDGEQDGANGGDLQFFTKVNNGSVTEKLRINNKGAIGIGGAIYGNQFNILASNGSDDPPEWTDTLNIESINAGDAASNTNSSFTRVLVKMIQSIFKFYDLAENILASISSVADGAGGKLRFYTTNATSGLEVINLTIKESGAFGLGNAEDCGSSGQVLSSNGSGSPPSWINAAAPTLSKIMFHGTFNNMFRQSNQTPLVAGVRCCNGFNSNRFSPVGGGWDPGNGIFTAPRNCYMNFCWQGLMFSNAGNGTNNMEGVLLHQGSVGTKYIRCQYIPSWQDGQNQLQATPCVSAVLYMAAGDTCRPAGTSSADWLWYSLGQDTNVSFSGHNCD